MPTMRVNIAIPTKSFSASKGGLLYRCMLLISVCEYTMSV